MSLGAAGAPAEFAATVGLLEAAGVDSLWLPENVYGPAVEPFTGMTFALAKTERLKVGSGISVLPGRHPVLVAKQLASLAGLAPGRVLPVFGLQPALAAERVLFPVAARAAGRGVRRGADPAAADADDRRGVVPRVLLHGGERVGRAAAGQAAGHLAGRIGRGRAAPGGTARRRMARLAAHPGGGGRSRRRDQGRGRRGGTGGGPGSLRDQPAGRVRRHPGRARGLDQATPSRTPTRPRSSPTAGRARGT